MPLSRLDNFLKNARGNILYVNPNDLDATDSIENHKKYTGNSKQMKKYLKRNMSPCPFRTIQRAVLIGWRWITPTQSRIGTGFVSEVD